MNHTPEISVIMSVYNGEDYLSEAIESVLAQTFPHWELIVINDCSTDGTAEILRNFAERDPRVKVHTNEVNLRLPSSLNKALSLAKGKYIARMDADDICLPERLEKQYAFMEKHPEIALSSCRFMTLKNGVIASGGCGGKTDDASIKALLLVTNPILHPGIIAKAEAIKALGYDKNFTCTEDMELWCRFVLAGYKVEILSDYLMIYRLHDKQITETTLEKQKGEVIAIQKKYFASLLCPMTAEQEELYITGVYFRRKLQPREWRAFYRFAKKVNRKQKNLEPAALDYAFFEILAEYKRNGLSGAELGKSLLSFGPLFLWKELPARKNRAREDGKRCIEAANRIGLECSGGTPEFPIFSKR